MAHLDEILEVNRRAAPVQPDGKGLAVEAVRELCIVTCVDPRLTRFFSSVLGIDRGDAVLIRLPGANLLGGHADALRAVAAAVYINRASEVILLGHTDCGTTRIDAGAISSRMQKDGIALNAMPGGPRDFLGGVGDLRSALRASAAAIRSAPYLPRHLLVHCALLDIQTGVLEVLERGEDAMVQAEAVSGDSLAYRPGPGGMPRNPLGEGLALLNASVHTLFSGDGALASSADAFATPASLASTLPPGWADGQAALASAAISAAGNSLDAVDVSGGAPAVTSSIDLGFTAVNLTPGIDVTSFTAKSRPQHHPEPAPKVAPPPIPKKRNRVPAPKARTADVEATPVTVPAGSLNPRVRANIERVRDFYRIEFPLEKRRGMARALGATLNKGETTDQLLKLILRPILESGQKRYKVIDEMIAIKTYVAPLPPDEAYAVLSMVLE